MCSLFGDETLKCCVIGFVQPGVDHMRPSDVKVFVVDGQLLRYDLLLRVDIIKRLGGVCVASSGTVSYSQLATFLRS